MTYIDQTRQDEPISAELPAWAWRMVVYAGEAYIDHRYSVGQGDVAARYQRAHDLLTQQLGVSGSGDLPLRSAIDVANVEDGSDTP